MLSTQNSPFQRQENHVKPLSARLTLATMSLALAACATIPKDQQVLTKVESLPPQQVPVLIRCVSLREIPPPPGTRWRPGMNSDQKDEALKADLLAEEQWRIKAESLLRGCLNERELP